MGEPQLEPARLRAGGGAPSSSSTRRAAVRGAAPHLNISLGDASLRVGVHARALEHDDQNISRCCARPPPLACFRHPGFGRTPCPASRSLLMWMLAHQPAWPAHHSLQASLSQAPPASCAPGHETIGSGTHESPGSGEADAFVNSLYSFDIDGLGSPANESCVLAASAGVGNSPDGLDTHALSAPSCASTSTAATVETRRLEAAPCNQSPESSGARSLSPVPSLTPSRSPSPSRSSDAINLKRSSVALKQHHKSKQHRVLESGSEDEDASGELVQQHAAQPFCPPRIALVSAAIACSHAISNRLSAVCASHSSCSGREQDGK